MSPKDETREKKAKVVIRNNRDLFKALNSPCTLMDLSTSVTEKYIRGNTELDIKRFWLKIQYATNTYEEILELRAYEVTSFLAEMGGYIGVFLGWSVFQGLVGILLIMKWVWKNLVERILH